MQPDTFSDKVFLLITGLTGLQAYSAILIVLLACGLGLPVPEDITLFAAGILVYTKNISLAGAIAVCYVGVLTGDTFLFFIGRKFGRQVITWPYFRRIFTPERIKKAEGRILKRRKIVCFTARFMPGLRAPIYLTSGILKVPPHIFFLMDGVAAAISVPVWVILAYKLGGELQVLFKVAHQAKTAILTILALLILAHVIQRIRKRLKPDRDI